MDNQQEQQRRVKVALLGDRNTGKTFLARRLAGEDAEEYAETTEVGTYGEEGSRFVYVDHPLQEKGTAIEIGDKHHYDILVLTFKGCDSFTKLYEFLEEVKETIQSSKSAKVKYYWHNLKKVFLVYNDFESPLPVQLDQLFPILTEQINSFSPTAIIKEFALKKQENNLNELKSMIEEEITFIEVPEGLVDDDIQKQQAEGASKTVAEGTVEQKGEKDQNGHFADQKIENHSDQAQHIDVEEEKIAELRKTMIYKKIHQSFFNEETIQIEPQEEINEEIPKEYENVEKDKSNEKEETLERSNFKHQETDVIEKDELAENKEEKENKQEIVDQIEKESADIEDQKKNHQEQEIKDEKEEKNVEKKEVEEEKEEKEEKEVKEDKEKEEKEEKEEKKPQEGKNEKKDEKNEKEEKSEEKKEKKEQKEVKQEDKVEKAIEKKESQEIKQQKEKQQSKIVGETNKQKKEVKQTNQHEKKIEKKIIKQDQKEKEMKSIAHSPDQADKTSNQNAPRPQSGMSPVKKGEKQQKASGDPRTCACLIM